MLRRGPRLAVVTAVMSATLAVSPAVVALVAVATALAASLLALALDLAGGTALGITLRVGLRLSWALPVPRAAAVVAAAVAVVSLNRLLLATHGGGLCGLSLGCCALRRSGCRPALVRRTLLAIAPVMRPALAAITTFAVASALARIATTAGTPHILHLRLGGGRGIGWLCGGSRAGLNCNGRGLARNGCISSRRRCFIGWCIGGHGINRHDIRRRSGSHFSFRWRLLGGGRRRFNSLRQSGIATVG